MSYVTDKTYKGLSPKARIMFGVVVDVRAHQDNEFCLKNQFFHAIDTLADLADLSHKHAVYAIKELIDRGILKRYPRPGQSTLYEYIPYEPSVVRTPPPSVFKTPPPSVPTTPHNNCIEQIQLTTTNNVNEEVVVVFEKSVRKEEETIDMKFDWIDDLSLESLIKKHGEKYVLDRAIPINKANGKIKDKKACLEDSLKLGYIYTCKEIKEQEQKEKHKKYVDEQIEKNRLEQEERERSFSESDPEAVRKLIADCIANLGKTK